MLRYQDLLCRQEKRRALIRADETLNGIDYLEVASEPPVDEQRVLRVYFIPKQTAAGRAKLGEMLDVLATPPYRIQVQGGVRIRDVGVVAVARADDHLRIRVDQPGDFSDYTLAIDYVRGEGDDPTVPKLDPVFAQVVFNFKAACRSHFDCRPADTCSQPASRPPVVDYMAKDYASFRQALLDRIALINPEWKERSAADVGMALVELLAYAGDQLSYYQDAVANEAYFETARQRISVRRHARLIDYRMHDGASALAFVHFQVTAAGYLPAGTQVLARITAPLGADLPPHPSEFDVDKQEAALAAAPAVFETLVEAKVHPALNCLTLHTWGREQCCLPRGATTADLAGDLTALLHEHDFLLLEEVKGTNSGLPQDADLRRRQVVRLTGVQRTFDPALSQTLTRVTWDPADALEAPFCLSAKSDKGVLFTEASVARGNLVLADHGRTLKEWHPAPPEPDVQGITLGRRAYRFWLRESPLSFRIEPGRTQPASKMARSEARAARAQVKLKVLKGGKETPGWELEDTLLGSQPDDRHFVVEVDHQGRALIRFGDNVAGEAPPAGAFLEAEYRVGVGARGNVPSEALCHVVRNPSPKPAKPWPAISLLRNPMPAWGGADPEPIEEVKLTAPAALHQEIGRAVTEADYAKVAEIHPEVSKAVAAFRWTGAWHTVFLTIDPAGSATLAAETAERVRQWVTRFLQAGYDLKIQPPVFVPLEIDVTVCVKPAHFRAEVEQALLAELSSRELAGGRLGFFHPDRFTFGQALYLSQLYSAMVAIEGVQSAEVTLFKRFGKPAGQELEDGVISVGRTEVVRLDNDPNFPENGVLRLNMQGGK